MGESNVYREVALEEDSISVQEQKNVIVPQKICFPWYVKLSRCIIDILTLLLSIAFLVYASLIIRLNDTSTENPEAKRRLLSAAKAGPTIFPLLFVAAVGRTLRCFTFWRLQKGEKLYLLDQLIDCTSLFGTATTQFEVGGSLILAIALLLLWALSPLGGQSSLRALDFRATLVPTQIQLGYVATNSTGGARGLSYGDGGGTFFPPRNAIYSAAMAVSPEVKSSPRDLWTNFKVPMISQYNHLTPNRQGWVDIKANASNDTIYSSLIGVPITSLPDTGNASFQLETSYMVLECSSMTSNNNSSGPPGWSNSSDRSIGSRPEVLYYPLDDDRNYPSNWSTQKPRELMFVLVYNGLESGHIYRINCTLSSTYLETGVHCDGGTCEAVKLRNSTQQHLPMGWTPLDRWAFKNFATKWLAAFDTHASRPSVFGYYIEDPSYPFSGSMAAWKDFSDVVSLETFSLRASQMLNTYWMSVMAPSIIPLGGTVSNFSLVPGSASDEYFPNTTYIYATHYRSEEVYTAVEPWISILIVAALVTLTSSLIGIGLQWRNRTPALAMNVSTVIRDSKYMQLPLASGGSYMSDSERGKLLRNTRIVFGDVLPDKEVGHIGFTVQRDGKARALRLEPDRVYE